MHFDPEQLRVFSALMTEGSTSRASLELRTSRSNVRRIWQHLEDQLGETLFVTRDSGGTEPTPAARCLEREMGALLDEVRRFEATVRKIHQNGRVLRLGADRKLFTTGHFGRVFNTLRHDPRFRVSFLEVGVKTARRPSNAVPATCCSRSTGCRDGAWNRGSCRPWRSMSLVPAITGSKLRCNPKSCRA
jgi:hypothetical protein